MNGGNLKNEILANTYFKKTRNSIIVQNTKVFDSIFHILFGLLSEESFKTLTDVEIKNFATNYFKHGAKQQTYLARTKFLQRFVNLEEVNGMKILDCAKFKLKDIIESCIAPIWPSVTKYESCKCTKNEIKIGFLNIKLDLAKSNNVFNLKKVHRTCNVCHEKVQVSDYINNLVFIELCGDQQTDFKNIPKVVLINHSIYTLSGFMIKISSPSDDLNHYISHVLKGRNWYIFDNEQDAPAKSNFKKKTMVPVLLVYTRPNLQDTKEMLIPKSLDLEIVSNFHTIVYEGETFQLNNVCGPDSLLHAFICLFIDKPQLFAYKTGTLIDILGAYAGKDMDKVYKYRVKLLKTIFKTKKQGNVSVMNCVCNISFVIRKLFDEMFPSAVFNCACGLKIHIPMLTVNYDQLYKYGIDKLERCISQNHRACHKCCIGIKDNQFGDLVFIDVEPYDDKSLAGPISSIPSEIELAGSVYRLNTIFDYTGNSQGGHYTAYCLRNDNTFYHFNDISTTVSISERSVNVSPHVLIYVKTIV